MYKLRVIKLFYKVVSDDAPQALSYLANKSCAAYDSQHHASIRTSVKALLATEVPSYGKLYARTTPAANLRLFVVK